MRIMSALYSIENQEVVSTIIWDKISESLKLQEEEQIKNKVAKFLESLK